MKVICIGEFDTTGHRMPAIGDIVTVIHQEVDEGMLMYLLREYPPIEIGNKIHRYTFEAEAFAPLNGPDEKIRLESWQEERLTQEDKMLQALAECMPPAEMSDEMMARVWSGIEKHLANG